MFGEVGSVTVGGTPSTSVPEYWGGAIPWMASGDVHGRIIEDVPTRISGRGLRHSSAMMVDPPSVAVALAGQGRTRGTAAYIRCALCTNQSVALLKGNPGELDTEYLLHNLSFRYSELRSRSAGGGRAGLTKTILEQLPLPLPAVPEQSKIAEVLSTVDRAIEQTEALIAKHQRIKTGLMQDLLTRGIDEHGNLRSEETHEFKDSPLGRIPVEWDIMALYEIVDESITYGIVQAGPHVDGGVPYIRTGDMRGDEINVEKLLRTAPQVAKSYKRSAVWVGDIVFALRATVGKVLPATVQLDGANLTQGTAKISPNKSIDSDFLLWAMRTSQVQNAIRLEQKGTTFMEITLGDLRTIRLALPKKKDEQSLIAAKLIRLDRLRRDYAKQRDKLVSLKRGLMQDLLTGNRRVTALLEQREGVTA